MSAQCMRLVAALFVVLAMAPALAQDADVAEIHRRAVDAYRDAGDITSAVVPMQQWKPQDFDRAIAALVASGDIGRMKAAAVLHLDIGIALMGLNTLSAKVHIDLGDHLLNKVRDFYKEIRVKEDQLARLKEHDAFRAIYLAVAGSAFVAVRDIRPAMPYIEEARDLAPQSAHVITVLGIAHETDGTSFNPADWSVLSQRERNQRERIVRLGRAERAYREALQLDEHYALASIRLGRVLQLDGKLREAREALDRGMADARGAFQEYVGALLMAALLQDLKDVDGARRSYERALAVVPSSQPAVVGLAHLEVMAGRPDRAQQLVRAFTSTRVSDTWWAYKDGALDLPGLLWLREQIRQ